MNISRHEVTEFQYSSACPLAAEAILTIGTANTNTTKIRVTDLKVSCATAGTTSIKLFVTSYGTYGQALEFDLTAGALQNFTWEIPYKFEVVASTVENRRFVASASGIGIKYAISGYIEK